MDGAVELAPLMLGALMMGIGCMVGIGIGS